MTDSELLSKLISKFGIERVRDFAEVEAYKYSVIQGEVSWPTDDITQYVYWNGIKERLDKQINGTIKGY